MPNFSSPKIGQNAVENFRKFVRFFLGGLSAHLLHQ